MARFKFSQLSKMNKKSDRIKYMLVNVVAKETYIIVNIIRNRYIYSWFRIMKFCHNDFLVGKLLNNIYNIRKFTIIIYCDLSLINS